MSKILNYSACASLTPTSIKIDEMNSIIFKTAVIDHMSNITTTGGKHYVLNLKSNTAVEITPASIKKGAVKAVKASKDKHDYLQIAEEFGLIKELTFTQSTVASDCDFGNSLSSLCDTLNLKVKDITIVAQNDLIFAHKGVDLIDNLTKDSGKLYQLDTKRNTATLVNPESIAKKATKDFLKGKLSDETYLSEAFNLITSVTLVAR